ncbi:hypothetical protein [Sphingomonas sp.]|uniref:hypothetical protein n=1 Tax=Sphingomonas sp. TaxID=28214 RepID=UPI000DB77834|nr:hypothetical protein [Sphingomonas sp.]PZU10044.1 MAG: hypothetical protein DI605_05435 [Sphingomonas sp.]
MISTSGTTRLVALGAAVLAAIALAAFLTWWFLVRPRQAQTQAATSTASAVIAGHGEKAAVEAMGIQQDVNQRRDARRALTSENDHALKSAAGASSPVDPAFARAFHNAVCLRDAYRAEPDCEAVQAAGGRIGAAEADAGSDAADR